MALSEADIEAWRRHFKAKAARHPDIGPNWLDNYQPPEAVHAPSATGLMTPTHEDHGLACPTKMEHHARQPTYSPLRFNPYSLFNRNRDLNEWDYTQKASNHESESEEYLTPKDDPHKEQRRDLLPGSDRRLRSHGYLGYYFELARDGKGVECMGRIGDFSPAKTRKVTGDHRVVGIMNEHLNG